MPRLQHRLLFTSFALALASIASLAFALPGPIACLFVEAAELNRLSDGSLTDSASESEQQHYVALTRLARARIESVFGPPESNPILVFLSRPEGVGPFKPQAFGTTEFIGSRACVMIGPKGQNIDVVAHELMHAEIHHRVGYMTRFLRLPTWFDEGIAMQVDERPRYALSPQDAQNAYHVREFTTFSSFFNGNEDAIVRNYAAAKYLLAAWLSKVGRSALYSRLQRMRDGESFTEATAE